MYQAEITGKAISRGVLSVEVSFSDGSEAFTETFTTNQYQKESWIGEQIERRLKHLNSLFLVRDSIAIGTFQQGEPTTKTDIEIYQEKRAMYLNYRNEALIGLISYERPIVVELKEWLIANFKDEYITMLY